MLPDDFLWRSVIALVLGALIGLKNQVASTQQEKKTMIGGFRSYGLVALLGIISGVFYNQGAYLLTGILSGTVLLFVLIYYAEGSFKAGALGITDEVTVVLAHFVGILAITDLLPLKYVIAFSVLTIFVITRKKQFRSFGKQISEAEMGEFSLFAILALVILPFLPNHTYSLQDIGVTQLDFLQGYDRLPELLSTGMINPFIIGLIVVLMTGIDAVSYTFNRFTTRAKGQLWSATIAGFVSSTATTSTLALQSKGKEDQAKNLNLISATLAANGSSFVEILILVAPISLLFFQTILGPTLVLLISCFVAAWYLQKYIGNVFPARREYRRKTDQILSLVPILKFVILFATVQVVTKVALIVIGESAFVATSMLAGITGIDAVTVNLAGMVETNQISLELALFTFMGANLVNLGAKVFYSYSVGSRRFASQLAFYLTVIFFTALVVSYVTAQGL